MGFDAVGERCRGRRGWRRFCGLSARRGWGVDRGSSAMFLVRCRGVFAPLRIRASRSWSCLFGFSRPCRSVGQVSHAMIAILLGELGAWGAVVCCWNKNSSMIWAYSIWNLRTTSVLFSNCYRQHGCGRVWQHLSDTSQCRFPHCREGLRMLTHHRLPTAWRP